MAATDPYRVLVVDDDGAQRRYVADLLSSWGLEPECAGKWSTAIASVSGRRIDMAILDVVLPDVDGFKLCEFLKRQQAPESFLPVIMMTGIKDRGARLRALKAGADDFIVKPVDDYELQARVTSMRRIQKLTTALEQTNSRLRDATMTDPLTGVGNRRALDLALERQVVQASERPISLLMIDADHFKRINDQLGHQAGDTALVNIARLVQQTLRETDIFARYGGEEFVAVLPNCSAEQAQNVAERIRNAVAMECTPPLTVSIGVVSAEQNPPDPATLLKVADEAVYDAKRSGRNCVRQTIWQQSALI